MDSVAKEILHIIEQNGFEAYLVGGYPRDLLLNIETEDFDMCTNAKKEDLEKIFNMSFKSNFGSIVLKYKEKIFEITTYRKEIKYEDVRTPVIVYTSKLEEDLTRRDFTINAICMNYHEKVIDLIGGVKDLNDKVIRCIGNSNTKISEDPLRILRAIRLASVLNFNIDDELSLSIKNNNYRVKELSYFRKRQELEKIFNSKYVNRGIELLKDYGLLEYLDIEVDKIVKSSNLGIWAQIKYSPKYPFTNQELEIILKIRKMISKKEISDYDLYLFGLDIGLIAGEILNINHNDVKKQYSSLIIKKRNEIDINYEEIVKHTDLKVSDIYSLLEKELLNNNLKNERKDIIKYIRKLDINNIDK